MLTKETNQLHANQHDYCVWTYDICGKLVFITNIFMKDKKHKNCSVRK